MKKFIALLLAALLLISTAALASDKYDLDNFGYRTVKTRGRGNLVFQSKPGGSFMSEYSFSNGDRIYVNLDWEEDGYAIAYKNGDYCYVDASYIDWGSGSRGSALGDARAAEIGVQHHTRCVDDAAQRRQFHLFNARTHRAAQLLRRRHRRHLAGKDTGAQRIKRCTHRLGQRDGRRAKARKSLV
jgi:hypothetical protein